MNDFSAPFYLPEILQEYDRLSHAGNFSEAGEFLRAMLLKAKEAGDRSSQLTILSEMMGLYRMAGDKERSLKAVDEGLTLMETLNIGDSASAGTICINAATALQAAGKAADALPLYLRAQEIYRQTLDADDPLMAGLCNNMAAAYGELGDFDSAVNFYLQALDILQSNGKNPDAAVTYVNLARLYSQKDEEMCRSFLDCAAMVLDDPDIPRNSYYIHTCSKCVPVFRMLGRDAEAEKLQIYLDGAAK